MMFGTRHLDSTERHEGMVAAIAFESVVKLVAFLAVGAFVTWGMFGGLGDLFARADAVPELKALLTLGQGQTFAYEQWFALTVLSMLSVIFLPRQFQVIVVENVDERHLKRAAWVFPLYLLLINLFVLPIAFGGLLHFGAGTANADAFVLSLPLAAGRAGAGAGGLHRRPVGSHRHDHRRGHRGVDDGLQRPRDAGAAAHRPAAPGAGAATSPALLLGMRRGAILACCCWATPTSISPARPMRWSASASSALPRWRSSRRRRWAACTGRAARSAARWRGWPPASCSGPTR